MGRRLTATSLGIAAIAAVISLTLQLAPSADGSPILAGLAPTGTPTLQMRTVLLSKEDADTEERLAGWELIAYPGADCEGHPVNVAFTAEEPVALQLTEGEYSFLEEVVPGWTNVTPLCQDIDLTSTDGELVFRNRREGTPDAQPDLVVESIVDAQHIFDDCLQPAGVDVTIRNAGASNAVESVTRVSVGGTEQLVPTPAIAAGDSVTVYSSLTGIPLGDTYTAEADYNEDIDESDEQNNALSAFLSLGTLPTCTSTPASVTPEGTPTATPDMNTVLLSKENAETGQRLAGWELIAYHGPNCEGHPINADFTELEPVSMVLQAGVYSFFETTQLGWVNVTPICQAVDLRSGDATLVFRNRQLSGPGDADCDGIVTSVDAALILQLNAGLIDAIGCQLIADVFEDGVLNSLDALLILQDVAGLIDLDDM